MQNLNFETIRHIYGGSMLPTAGIVARQMINAYFQEIASWFPPYIPR